MSTLPRSPSYHCPLSFYRVSGDSTGTNFIGMSSREVVGNSSRLDDNAADQATKLSEGAPALDIESQAAFPKKPPSRPEPWGYSRTIHDLFIVVLIILAVLETVLTFTVPVDVDFEKKVSSDPFQIVKVS